MAGTDSVFASSPQQERFEMEEIGMNWKEKLPAAGRTFFYGGFFIDLLVVILDKSDYINPYESWMFRIAFLLFVLKICLTRYTARELGWMILFGLVGVLCYFSSTRDEAVRIVVFCMALKGMDWKKVLKAAFWFTTAGVLLLVLLSVTGIYGNLYRIADYGRGDGELRYCLGLGHPNALSCMVFVLMVLGIALYHEKMRWWYYGLLAVLSILTYVLTVSRTTLLLMFMALAVSLIFRYIPSIMQKKWVYMASIAAFLLLVVLSVYAAYYGREIPPTPGRDYPQILSVMDKFLNGRIQSSFIFENENGFTFESAGGVITNWSLFSAPENDKYFDTGYIRLFYWYGIIPGTIYVLMYTFCMWHTFRKKEPFYLMLLLMFAIYTMIEAHFISVYIGRNYMLVLMGAWWSEILHADKGKDAYWWQFYKLLPGKGGNA